VLKSRLLLIFSLIVVLLAIGLVPAASQDNSELVVALNTFVDSLDPGVTTSSNTGVILWHVVDTLIYQDPLGTFHPGLATEWSVNEDATEYTFKLREDVTFHDGTPLNAEAVKFSFDRIVDPALNSQMAFSFIGGPSYAETEVVDDYTVTVKFNRPFAPFYDSVAHPQLGIVSPAAVQESGAEFGQSTVVGTGPFMLESYTPDAEVVLVRNPDYNWGSEEVFGRSGPADIERIRFLLVLEPTTRLASLESGDADFIDSVPPQDVARLQDEGNVSIVTAEQPGHGYSLMFNFDKAPTDDLAVRQAIAMAVDKQGLLDTVFNGLGKPGCSALTPVMFGFDPATCDYLPYNVEEANRILEEAGWVDSDGDGVRERDGQPLVIEHYFRSDSPINQAMATFLQADLAKIGVNFNLNPGSGAGYFDAVRAGEHNTQNWWDTQTDPDGVMRTLFHSSNADGGTNRNRYRNEEMDALLDQAAGESDPEARVALYAQIQQKIADEAIMVFFQDPLVVFGANQCLQGVKILGGGFAPHFYAANFTC
jgi:peptide/nickel transport system substrate-binding protein